MSGDPSLLAYRMPITKIIEDQSVDAIRDEADNDILDRVLKGGRYEIPIHRVRAQKFKQEKFPMHRHLNSSRIVTVPRTDLIEKMKENRSAHAAIFEEAIVAYDENVREALRAVSEELAQIASTSGPIEKAFSLEKITAKLEIEKPRHYLQAYDEAIELFEWEKKDDVDLSVDEFRKYVLDRWDWQDRFLGETRALAASAVIRSRALGIED